MTDGKISVLMGIFNCAGTLPQAIDSILNQTYQNFELILCDDCSTDNTYSVAFEYASKYPGKIILIKNEKNSHLAFSLNRCLALATGEYCARMDGDDISAPDRFEKQLAYLHSHPGAVLCGTAMRRFDSGGNYGSMDIRPAEPDRDTPYKTVPFNHASILCFKSVYDTLGGYTVAPRTERGQDRDLWYRFFAAGFNGVNTDEPLYFVREDEGAIRRRTFKVRFNSFKTDIIGYRLLGYPLRRYLRPLVRLAKAFVPVRAQLLYRKWQAKNEK